MKRNVYLYFAVKLILLLLIVFLIDFCIGNILRHFYLKEGTGRQYRATYTIEKTTDDILIFGSSRAYHHYVPSIIEDSLKQSCYNTGSPGQFLLYNYATLKAVLKRYSPKLIILDVSPRDLAEDKESYDRLSFLLPYYRDHPEIRPIVDLKSPFEKYKLLSSIYPFNSKFLMIIGGNLNYFKNKFSDIKGYKPLYRKWNKSIEIKSPDTYKLDRIKEKVFLSFIEDCDHAGSNLLVVCSPNFIKYNKPDYSITVMQKYAKSKNISFIDFTNDTAFINHPDLFDDLDHLNKRGSEIFTINLVEKLKKRP